MPINVDQSPVNLSTLDRNPVEVVTYFYYLRTWIASAQHAIKLRWVKAWSALHSMNKVWRSRMNPDTCMKAICRYGRKCVLLNGCEAWALTVADEKSLVYTSLLRKALESRCSIMGKTHDKRGLVWEVASSDRQYTDTAEENGSDWSRHPELASCELMMWEHGSRNA